MSDRSGAQGQHGCPGLLGRGAIQAGIRVPCCIQDGDDKPVRATLITEPIDVG